MAGWELALVIFAATYMMVNTVALFVQVKMMNEYKGVITKSLKLMEKILDKSDKAIDDLFDNEL